MKRHVNPVCDKARALGIGRSSVTERNDGWREVQPPFIPKIGPATTFRLMQPEMKAPANGVWPLTDAPAFGGAWTVKEPGFGLAVLVYGDHDLFEMRRLHDAGWSFYPMNPSSITEENHMQIAELRKQSKLSAKQAGLGTVSAFFQQNKGAITAVLPKHATADRLLKIAYGAIRTTPALTECTVESLFGAVIKCAELGLEPNTPLGHAYLVPFNVKRGDSWNKDVQVIIGYKGFVDLARRSGQIISISAHEVCEHDEFQYEYGLNENLVHRPAMNNRGQVIAYYAVAKLQGGGHAFEVMSVDQIQDIRDNAQGWQQSVKYAKKNKAGEITVCSSPWFNHPVEMGRKTVVRRLMKYLPLSIELAGARELDERGESDSGQQLGDVLTGEYSVDPETAPEELEVEVKIDQKKAALPQVPDKLRAQLDVLLEEIDAGRADEAREVVDKLTPDQQAILRPHLDHAIGAKS